MLYEAAMSKAGVKAPTAGGICPSGRSKGSYFHSEITYPHDLPGAGFLLQPPPYQASQFTNNAWVEVMHGSGGGVGSDENIGAWFYWLKGSGIWYNLGKQISFPDHLNSWLHFGVMPWHAGTLTDDEAMSKAASAAGYDSVIYLAHFDEGTCPPCCMLSGFRFYLVEIVAVKLVGKYACASRTGRGVRAGWQGSRPCGCREFGHKSFINCRGLPTLHLTQLGRWSNMTSIPTDSVLLV
jgi:hypothetical protein